VADVEAWLKTLEPEVLDRWLLFAELEPQWFVGGGGGDEPIHGQTETKWMDAREAGDFFSRWVGGHK